MKKFIALILLTMFTSSNIFAEEIPWKKQNSNETFYSQNYRIKQNGNRVKISVPKNNTQTKNNTNDNSVTQNTDGRVDIVTTQNNLQTSKVNQNQGKIVAGSVLATAGLMLAVAILDPYAVKIDGQKYYMVRDKENNQYTIEDILGYDDKKSDLFDDMKSLNSDDDTTKITRDELKKAGIRFVAVKKDKLQLYDKSQDYNLDNIEYIDLTTLRGTVNNGQIGSFGYFDMYVNNNHTTKKIIGFVTFDSDKALESLISQ